MVAIDEFVVRARDEHREVRCVERAHSQPRLVRGTLIEAGQEPVALPVLEERLQWDARCRVRPLGQRFEVGCGEVLDVVRVERVASFARPGAVLLDVPATILTTQYGGNRTAVRPPHPVRRRTGNVPLAVVVRVIARGGERLRDPCRTQLRFDRPPVPQYAVVPRHQAGPQTRPRRAAQRERRVARVEDGRLAPQLVQVRRPRRGVAGPAHRVPALLVSHDDQHIQTVGHSSHLVRGWLYFQLKLIRRTAPVNHSAEGLTAPREPINFNRKESAATSFSLPRTTRWSA